MTGDELRNLAEKAFHDWYVNSHGEQPNLKDCRTRDEFNAFIEGFDDGYLVGFKIGKKLAADEIDRLTAEHARLQSDRQALIDELFRVRDLITGQEDYDIVTKLLKDMGENAGAE